MRLWNLTSSALLMLMALVPLPIAAAGQDAGPQLQERRVLVFRTEGDQALDLPAVAGKRGFLGVGLLDLTEELRRHFSVPLDRGVMISRVLPESPAERAGLEPADILTTFDGEALTTATTLSMRVAQAEDGDAIDLERWRDGRPSKVRVVLETRSRSQFDLSPLVRHRISRHPGQQSSIDTSETAGGDQIWIEKVVESVDESFSGATFLEQLEALRRERAMLLDKLEQMEGRLGDLEAELGRLDGKQR